MYVHVQAIQLKLKNSLLKAKLLQVKAKTDVDISDEFAGAARLAAAEASRKKKAEDNARIAAENAAMRQRIEAVQVCSPVCSPIRHLGSPFALCVITP